MHQKGRFFASETLNYAFFSQKTGCFCTEMIHSVFCCTVLGQDHEYGVRPTLSCGPAAVLVAVNVKIEVFLRHFVVVPSLRISPSALSNAAFSSTSSLRRPIPVPSPKYFLSFTDGPAKAKSFRQVVSGSLRWRRLHPAAPHPDGQLRDLNRSDPGSGRPPRQRPGCASGHWHRLPE